MGGALCRGYMRVLFWQLAQCFGLGWLELDASHGVVGYGVTLWEGYYCSLWRLGEAIMKHGI
jgi:hypothetical protein